MTDAAADGAIRIGDKWYIAATAARADESPQVLKSDDSFALFDRFGDIRSFGGGEQGLYHRDTRFLSQLELTLGGVRPLFLGATVKERNNLLIVEMMNPDLVRTGQRQVGKGEIHLFRAKLLWDAACYEHLRLAHHGPEPVTLDLALRFDADFRDLFEVRGLERKRRGRLVEPHRDGSALDMAYDGLDGERRTSRVRFEPAPTWAGPRQATWQVELKPGEEWHLYCTIACDVGHEPRDRAPDYDAAFRANGEAASRRRRSSCRVETSNPLVDRWLDRSASDLAMLTTDLPSGPYPYAGVPWYSTVFGRDGLITALEMLWIDPSLARGVLACLGEFQARDSDAERDAEPGKILHEVRLCEMARTGEVPFAQYYGSVDATPLFVALAGAYWRRTGDLDFCRRLWPRVLAALDWIDRYGDRDRDGFVEYARRSSQGLVQQGWKDSHDSVFHADGTMAEPPIALAEVQAYVFDAKHRAAELAEALGEGAIAARLHDEAGRLREEFRRRFWCEDIGAYAIALDGAKRPCRVATSNAGHAMWAGIAAPEHAARMAERFFDDDFFGGWGVRTLAARQARYNPMSYHNGSVWPHDNALLAGGLARYGHTDKALRLFDALFDAGSVFDEYRMPELFCGFTRRGGDRPTLYPVACAPQAWSAATVFALLQACLGLEIDAPAGELCFRSPRLPGWLQWVELKDLRVGDASVDLMLQRYEHNVGVQVGRKSGPIAVRVEV